MAKKYAAKTAKNLNHKRHKVLLCTKAEKKIFAAFWTKFTVLTKKFLSGKAQSEQKLRRRYSLLFGQNIWFYQSLRKMMRIQLKAYSL